jgi:hypothetical protein
MQEVTISSPQVPASKWRPRPYFRPSPIRAFPRRTPAQELAFRLSGGVHCKKRTAAFDAVRQLGGNRIELIQYRDLVNDARQQVTKVILASASADRIASAWENHEYWVGSLAEIREEVKTIRAKRCMRHEEMEPLP